MTKTELQELLKKLKIPISDSTPKDDDMNSEIRICYWDYVWEDITSSGTNYDTKVTYQISIVADKPRHPKLLELKKYFNEKGIFPTIHHEYLTDTRRIHSFFSVEVLENVNL